MSKNEVSVTGEFEPLMMVEVIYEIYLDRLFQAAKVNPVLLHVYINKMRSHTNWPVYAI